ncbi:DUF4291 domain-containing protein [Streptomyces sp. NPDC102360]|uniref:DUF4291 domain-containing protein n=1 Tax=Streptomyces sp. NPDC102360 TaxID=3366160 RepID=UPI00381EF3F1
MSAEERHPERAVRAWYTDETITVYQAYSPAVADAALEAGTFVAPFKRDRMTWIKPSFLWMMYRSGWASKPSQERILAVEIRREGFEWALAHASLSSHSRSVHSDAEEWQRQKRLSPVRVQWDPDRDLHLNRTDRKAVQVGLSGEAVERYVDAWVVGITDVTTPAHRIHARVCNGETEEARSLLPRETVYELPQTLRSRIGADA